MDWARAAVEAATATIIIKTEFNFKVVSSAV